MRMTHLLAAAAALGLAACAAGFEARTDFGPDSGLDGLGPFRVVPTPEAPHGRAQSTTDTSYVAKGRADGRDGGIMRGWDSSGRCDGQTAGGPGCSRPSRVVGATGRPIDAPARAT